MQKTMLSIECTKQNMNKSYIHSLQQNQLYETILLSFLLFKYLADTYRSLFKIVSRHRIENSSLDTNALFRCLSDHITKYEIIKIPTPTLFFPSQKIKNNKSSNHIVLFLPFEMTIQHPTSKSTRHIIQ